MCVGLVVRLRDENATGLAWKENALSVFKTFIQISVDGTLKYKGGVKISGDSALNHLIRALYI